MPPSHETLAEEERRHLAYHVAAQVVVAVRLGFPVRSAALSPGRTPRARRLIDFGIDVAAIDSPSEQLERARDLIVATYAGPAGRRLVHHRAGPQHAAADEEAAYALSRTYRVLPPGGIEHFGEPRHLAYLDSLRDRALHLVRQLSDDIARVALALLEQGRLQGAALHRALAPVTPVARVTAPRVAPAPSLPRCPVCHRTAKLDARGYCRYHRRHGAPPG